MLILHCAISSNDCLVVSTLHPRMVFRSPNAVPLMRIHTTARMFMSSPAFPYTTHCICLPALPRYVKDRGDRRLYRVSMRQPREAPWNGNSYRITDGRGSLRV